MCNAFKALRKDIWIAAVTVIGISVGAMYGIVQTMIAAIDTGRAAATIQQPLQTAPIIITLPAAPTVPPAPAVPAPTPVP